MRIVSKKRNSSVCVYIYIYKVNSIKRYLTSFTKFIFIYDWSRLFTYIYVSCLFSCRWRLNSPWQWKILRKASDCLCCHPYDIYTCVYKYISSERRHKRAIYREDLSDEEYLGIKSLWLVFSQSGFFFLFQGCLFFSRKIAKKKKKQSLSLLSLRD